MKNIIAKVILCFMFIVMCVSIVPDVNAQSAGSIITPPEIEITRIDGGTSPGYTPVQFDDYYGATSWKSLAQAKAYYGYDFTYYSCGGAGSLYNYFYCFDDGSRMFFGVH